MRSATVFAPGKLFVIGEYAVLSGGRALVAALDAGIVCQASESQRGWWIEAPDLSIDLALDDAARCQGASLLAAAVSAGRREFGSSAPLRFRLTGNHRGTRRKCGLGGSAAAVVAVLGAMAAVAGSDLEATETRRRLFALALDVHRAHQNGRGSGADVAASVFGGWVDFTPAEGGPEIRPAAVPASLRLAAAWSGAVADTPEALASHGGCADVAAAAGSRLRPSLERFWSALGNGDRHSMLEAISEYGHGLAHFAPPAARAAQRRIDALVEAARSAGAAAKGSGAAGGDCVIALALGDDAVARAEAGWRRLGAEVLGVKVAFGGVQRERTHA